MMDPKLYPFCSEFYIVEKAVEVVVTLKGSSEQRRIRIDALHTPGPTTTPYSTKAYIEEDVTVQPTYPQTVGNFDQAPRSVSIWIDYELPWTSRSTADDAIAQALGFLKERCTP
jgi:hypothetical protein